MTSHSVARRLSGLSVAALCVAASLVGCGSEPEPQVQAPRAKAPPPPPPKPAVTPIETLMANHRIDSRVVLPEDKAPNNDPDRIAVLSFFDAFVRGDHEMVNDYLSMTDRLELAALVESGAWAETVANITEVELQCGDSEYGECVLALFEVDLEFQPQLWYFQGEEGMHTFDAAATPPDILDRLSGDDWIQAWHDVLAEELALADRPDEDVSVPQQVIDGGESNTPSNSTGPGMQPGNNPQGPGGPPRRRAPKKTQRKPPGPGGPGGR